MHDNDSKYVIREVSNLQKVAIRANGDHECTFTSVVHLIDVKMLIQAFQEIRKDAASGVDGITAEEYIYNILVNLHSLYKRLLSGEYKAKPVKRVWINKEDGRKRPLGIPALEDKIVQKAVEKIMNIIYEPIFQDYSFGFRPRRSQHDALKMIREKCLENNINWIVDADVSSYFDTIDHNQLTEFIKLRLNDGGMIRLINKWLKAGVMEEVTLTESAIGTPQEGIISPILSNIYLHYVLDDWFSNVVKPRMKSRCFMVRYADDFIVGFESKNDVERFMKGVQSV